MVIPLGAIPCSLKSYQTKDSSEDTVRRKPSISFPRYLLIHEVFWSGMALLCFLLP